MNTRSDAGELREEYDFTTEELRHGARGKYAERDSQGTGFAPLDPGMAEGFPDAASATSDEETPVRSMPATLKER